MTVWNLLHFSAFVSDVNHTTHFYYVMAYKTFKHKEGVLLFYYDC